MMNVDRQFGGGHARAFCFARGVRRTKISFFSRSRIDIGGGEEISIRRVHRASGVAWNRPSSTPRQVPCCLDPGGGLILLDRCHLVGGDGGGRRRQWRRSHSSRSSSSSSSSSSSRDRRASRLPPTRAQRAAVTPRTGSITG